MYFIGNSSDTDKMLHSKIPVLIPANTQAKDLEQSPIQSAPILRACGYDYVLLTTVVSWFN